MSIVARLTTALADRYTLDRELGAGGMATVYLAHDIKHDRQVAIKVLKPELAAVIGADRFLREIKTIAGLQHPHILGLIDSGELNGTAYYVMPFVEGESLRDRLVREKQLSIADTIRIATEVASALDYAHRRGVIHRDIKPENILLHDGQALVADFGIALAVSTAGSTRMTETGMSLGTPHYMSPEQAMGEREITARSDIYALGAMTYEMLIGEPPFTGPTAQAIIAKVVTSDPVSPATLRRTVPPNVDAAVLTALQKLPADRFADAAQFARALNDARTSGIAGTSPTSAGGAAPSTTRRSVGRLAVLGAAGIAIALGAFFIGRSGKANPTLKQVRFEQRTFNDQAVFSARFTHDGNSIVYSAAESGNTPRIFILRPDSPVPQPLADTGTHLLAVSSKDEMAVLVNPKYIAFRMFLGTLARIPIAGGAPREMVTNVRDADWSPDGTELAIVHEVDGRDHLEYPVGTVLVESEGYLSDIRVSPDGQHVAFLEHPLKFDDRGVVAIVDRKGKKQSLSGEYWGLQGLAWDTNGRRLLFGGADEAAYYQVHEALLDGQPSLALPSPGSMVVQDVSITGRWLLTREEQTLATLVHGLGATRERDIAWSPLTLNAIVSRSGRAMTFLDASVGAGPTYQTMFQQTNGTSAVRLGEGAPEAVSDDERWVLSVALSIPPRLMLYPTGPGQARNLDIPELEAFTNARFFPDGKQLLVCGNEKGKQSRCYARALESGPLRPVTPEGTRIGVAISPDGRAMLAQTSAGYGLYAVAGGAPVPVAGIADKERVVRFSPDGKSLWIERTEGLTLTIESLELATGRRQAMMTVSPENRAGVVDVRRISLSDDPHVYAYDTRKAISRIFTVTGMK